MRTIHERISQFNRFEQENSSDLNAMLEISRAITSNQSSDQLIRLFEFIMREQLQLDRFVLFTKNVDWTCLSRIGTKTRVKEINVNQELLRFKEITVIESSQSEVLSDFDVVIPIINHDRPLGFLLVGHLEGRRMRFSDTLKNMTFVQTLTSIVVLALENRKNAREQIKQERLTKELEVASEMQKLLFPSVLPSNKRMDISARYIPRHIVSGDYYDFIPLDDDRYVICIADVSGKGVSAAMLMANFQATVRAFVQFQWFDMKTMLHELNKTVVRSAKGEKFITFFMATYNANTRELTYVNAGHNQPFITDGKEAILLDKGCVGLGMFDELPFLEVGQEILEPNTTLVLYTDGVVELENDKKEHFELEQLIKIVHNFYRISMEDMNNIIFSKLDEWRGSLKLVDDTAIFSCRFF